MATLQCKRMQHLVARAAGVIHCGSLQEASRVIRKCLAVLWFALASTSAAAADRIERVEPASWWVGMKDDRLQLLVHGDRVAQCGQ